MAFCDFPAGHDPKLPGHSPSPATPGYFQMTPGHNATLTPPQHPAETAAPCKTPGRCSLLRAPASHMAEPMSTGWTPQAPAALGNRPSPGPHGARRRNFQRRGVSGCSETETLLLGTPLQLQRSLGPTWSPRAVTAWQCRSSRAVLSRPGGRNAVGTFAWYDRPLLHSPGILH